MTGADIIGALLTEAPDRPLPASSIKEDALPDNVSLPAILVRQVSSNERQHLRRGPKVRTTDRVSATVLANSVQERKLLIEWLKACCAGRTGDVGGGSAVSILTAGTGPSLRGPGNRFEMAQDFRVSFDA